MQRGDFLAQFEFVSTGDVKEDLSELAVPIKKLSEDFYVNVRPVRIRLYAMPRPETLS
jgi:hypothetical protein